MHGTWYKGQLAHAAHAHSNYHHHAHHQHHPHHPHHPHHHHQFRSFPPFMVAAAPYTATAHDSISVSATPTSTALLGTKTLPVSPKPPIIVEGSFADANTQLHTTQLTLLSSSGGSSSSPTTTTTIKIEQSYSEPQPTITLGVADEYATTLNLDCSIDNPFRKPTNYANWVNTVNSHNNNTLASIPISSLAPEALYSNSIGNRQHQQQDPSGSPHNVISPCSPAQQQHQLQRQPHAGHQAIATNNSSDTANMPVSGGVQNSQNATQGLVHWMSVMAEHMSAGHGQIHHGHDSNPVHYMWNSNADTKINDHQHHHNNMQKGGHFMSDNHLEHHSADVATVPTSSQSNQMTSLYAPTGLTLRAVTASNSQRNSPAGGGDGTTLLVAGNTVTAASSGAHHIGNHMGNHHSNAAIAAASAALLVVPHPINATKAFAGSGGIAATTGRKYQCKMCPQIFSSKADLQLHTQIHMREAKPYKCTQCSKAFANSSYLSQHTRIHLGIKPYRCEICQRKFTQLSHLQQHIRTHTGDKPYKCRHPGCQKAFSQLSNLQSHSRCHQTDKPFKCNSCYKCFSDEPSLLEHIPKHKESKHLKTHICQYCGKSYTQETYLTKHMQKHAERTDKRPPIAVANTDPNGAPATSTTITMTPGHTTASAAGSVSSNPAAVTETTRVDGTDAGVIGVGSGDNLNTRNNLTLPSVSITPSEHSYWPKVSPDSAAHITDVLQQQQHHHHHHQQQQQHPGQPHQHHHTQQQPPPPQQHQQHHHHQQHMDFSTVNQATADLQAHHRMSDTGRDNLVATPSTIGPYDASSITKTTTNSAFTPINSMPPHLNTVSHHPMAQRPYLYDAINFQNKNVNQSNSNSFPNQLISLHQIRNYTHQPTGIMAGEHLLGVSVGPGKDKG